MSVWIEKAVESGDWQALVDSDTGDVDVELRAAAQKIIELQTKTPCPYCSGKKIFQPLDMQPIIDRFCRLPFVIHANGTWSMDEVFKVLVTIHIQIDTEHWGNRCQVYGLEMEIMQQNEGVEFDFSCTAIDTPDGVTGGPSE